MTSHLPLFVRQIPRQLIDDELKSAREYPAQLGRAILAYQFGDHSAKAVAPIESAARKCPGIGLGRGLRIRQRISEVHGTDAGFCLHLAHLHPPGADGLPG